ncbi:hypothetical protein BC831DRAFT_515681 [Entophlyctis helioformis]|nr:hypothetical protein BC831DRAFT_515681 [Entophlyctis helioformis]
MPQQLRSRLQPNRTHQRPNSAPLSSLYVGIEIEVSTCPDPGEPSDAAFCVYVHDGFCGVDFATQKLAKGRRGSVIEPPSIDGIDPDIDAEMGRILVQDPPPFAIRPDPAPSRTRVASKSPSLSGRSDSLPSEASSAGDPSLAADARALYEELGGIACQKLTCDNLPANMNQRLLDRWIRPFEDPVIDWLKRYTRSPPTTKIQVAGIGIVIDGQRLSIERSRVGFTHCSQTMYIDLNVSLFSRLWFELDILPIVVTTDVKGSIDERACSAVRKAILFINPHLSANIPRINVGFRHEVEVDGGGVIRFCNVQDYRRLVPDATWQVLKQRCDAVRNKRISISFFNSTPVGGGVAIMRHSIVRFMSLLGIDVHWYVAKPKPEVFQITKHKFHNILQGVAPKDVSFSEHDKALYEKWCAVNAERNWVSGPFGSSDVIVIDDPQLIGIIPHIRCRSKSKVVFRCHIQVRNDLIEQGNNETARVWNYIWDHIKDVDGYIWHPIPESVPSCVPRSKLSFFPAFMDPLDGLCKTLTPSTLEYYLSIFNRLAYDRMGKRLAFPRRPYILQLSRFDPSKGIPDVIEAYSELRKRIESVLPFSELPQLVIAGIGAIDDPQGTAIYDETLLLLEDEQYQDIFSDVVPPAAVRPVVERAAVACHIYLQLSIREGFEIKVTEALHKGKPVVAYATGGIPLQIQHGVNGYLIETGNTGQVTDTLFRLLTDDEDWRKRATG